MTTPLETMLWPATIPEGIRPADGYETMLWPADGYEAMLWPADGYGGTR
jgi:hypothetical protein